MNKNVIKHPGALVFIAPARVADFADKNTECPVRFEF